MTTHTESRPHSIVGRARALAEATPASRNRYVDLLRAVSIVMVVIGHWLIAAPYAVDGELSGVSMLQDSPWTQWLTWVFQVMPVFFMVGGYSNRTSWNAAVRKGHGYGTWLAARVRRLLIPAVPLVLFWAMLGIGMTVAGVDESIVKLGSHGSLVVVWFLAAYVVVVALTPVASVAWDRYGWGSVMALAAAAAVADVAALAFFEGLGWANHVFVWVAIAQLGMAWQSGKLGGFARSIPLAAVAAGALTVLVGIGPYPVAMVGVPGADATNSSPPTLAMLAFGAMQVGILLTAERPMRGVLDRVGVWTSVVLANGLIMSVYLWHMTSMVLVVGGALLLDGLGLHLVPGSSVWWLSRPLWIALLSLTTIPFVLIFSRFDRVRAMDERVSTITALGALAAASFGLSLLAQGGIVGSVAGIRIDAVLLVVLAGIPLSVRGRALGRRLVAPSR